MTRSKFFGFLLPLAMAAGLGLMSMPGDSYACHKDIQHKPSNTEPCQPPDDTTILRTNVNWGGNIVESGLRLCVVQMVQTGGNNGSYVCELEQPPNGNQVQFFLGEGVQTARKGDDALCNVFEDISLTPNRKYNYAWADNCGDDGICTIQIFNWFQGDEVIGATQEKADFIRLVATVNATDMPEDLNPFVNVDGLTLDIGEITTTFFANGSNKKIAACQYDANDFGVVTFRSDPLL